MIGRNGLDENALDEKAFDDKSLDENWAHDLSPIDQTVDTNVGCPPWGRISPTTQTSGGSHASQGSLPYPL